MENKRELVFIPTGHIVPMVDFAKHLHDQHQHLSITILLIKPLFNPSYNLYVESLAASDTQFRYIHLPPPPPPPPSEHQVLTSPDKFFSDFLESYKSQVRDAIVNYVLSSSPATARLAGLVVDCICTAMIDVADEFAAPTYIFFTSSAAFLGLMLHLPIRHALIGTEFTISDQDSEVQKHQGHNRKYIRRAQSCAMKSLLVSPASPPVYAVGQLLDLSGDARLGSDQDKILKWLDEQAPSSSSVVFLCFGSIGCFDPPRLAEITAALEKSGHRFLWSIRRSPPKGEFGLPTDCGGDYDGLLPEGFLKRTENRGMMCGWAPQTVVPGHAAVGGFVSHCGWNSILESLWFGVPMVSWPMYAEQQINAFEMVVELDLAVELRLDYKCEFGGIGGKVELVAAEEIESSEGCDGW
ncbi:hypothetical protein ACSBR2_005265 [Camellia fascicularis]